MYRHVEKFGYNEHPIRSTKSNIVGMFISLKAGPSPSDSLPVHCLNPILSFLPFSKGIASIYYRLIYMDAAAKEHKHTVSVSIIALYGKCRITSEAAFSWKRVSLH